MRYPFTDRVRDYRCDPYFPTALPLAVVFSVCDVVAALFARVTGRL